MCRKSLLSSLFAFVRRKLFIWRVNTEIFERLFPHVHGEAAHGYPFRNRPELQKHTAQLGIPESLARIEQYIQQMPAAYGESFRYLLYRDLYTRLTEWEALAQSRRQPTGYDPRSVARPA